MGDGREEYWPSPKDGPKPDTEELKYTYEGTLDIHVWKDPFDDGGNGYFWTLSEWGEELSSGYRYSLEDADTAAKTAAWSVLLGRE